MAIDVGEPMGPVATPGSVLFVGSGPALAQDNAGFYFDQVNNTVRTTNAVGTGNSESFAVSTGLGGPNNSSSGTAGNSGTVTVTTGLGGTSENGSLPGSSGDLLLKTGTGGGTTSPSVTGGPAGHIILQPGNGGAGASAGLGGSTLVRASSAASDILKVQDSSGATTHVTVSGSGRIGAGTTSPTARLHLGAGSATQAPLKFAAGTNLTTPGAGAMEFDGTDLFITNSSGRRRYLTSDIANVLDFGAKGDGNVDDAAAFQAAVDSLINTGGVVWIPPGRTYQIGSKVVIKSRFPIWLKSGMGNRVLPGANGATHSGSALIRPNGNLTYMFEWSRPAFPYNNFGSCGGGGIDGVAFGDWIMPFEWRMKTIDGAINIDEANYFTIRDSYFAFLKGRALRIGRCVIGRVENTWIYQCGFTGKSAVDVDGSSLDPNIDKLITGVAKAPDPSTLIRVTVPSHGFSTNDIIYIAFVTGTTEADGKWMITVIDANTFDLQGSTFTNAYISGGKASVDGIYGALWGDSMGIEQSSHGSAWIKGTSNGHAWLKHCYFEDGGNNNQSFVDQSAGGGLVADGCSFNGTAATPLVLGSHFVEVVDCTFDSGSALQAPFITSTGNNGHFSGLRFRQANVNQVTAMTCTGQFNRYDDIHFSGTGNFDVGQNNTATGLLCLNCRTTTTPPFDVYVLKAGVGSSLVNCQVINANPNVSGILGTDNARIVGCYVTGQSGSIAKGVHHTGNTGVVTGCATGVVGGGGAYVLAEFTTAYANHGDDNPRESFEIALTSFRKVDASGDVGNSAANGGLLASDTTPVFRADANEGFEIVWAAGNSDPIAAGVALPSDLEAWSDVLIDLYVRTDNSGGGAIEAATFTVRTNWHGGAQIIDTATDTPSTSLHRITATVASADVRATTTSPGTLTVQLEPAAHANDPVQLLGVRVRYQKRYVSV